MQPILKKCGSPKLPLGINDIEKVPARTFSLGTLSLIAISRGTIFSRISCYKKKLPVEIQAIN
jgi:hypothetical protein